MAEFLVLSKDGMSSTIHSCVRVAKKSLVFDVAIDGKIEVPKDRCYYYNEPEFGSYFSEIRRVERQMRKQLKLGERSKMFSLKRIRDKIIKDNFKKVQVKSTQF